MNVTLVKALIALVLACVVVAGSAKPFTCFLGCIGATHTAWGSRRESQTDERCLKSYGRAVVAVNG
jgi:hypothetical protein